MESGPENATTGQPVSKRGPWRPSAFSGTSDKIHMRLDVRSTAILLRYELAAAEGVGQVSPKQ